MNEPKHKPEPSLDEVYKLAKDNNRMLRAMRREAFIGGIFKIVFWLLLFVVIPYLVYVWYLQPYLDQVLSLYQQAGTQAGQVNDAVNQLKGASEGLSGIQQFFEQFLPSGTK